MLTFFLLLLRAKLGTAADTQILALESTNGGDL